MKLFVPIVFLGGVHAYSTNNQPMAPGNGNFAPMSGGYTLEKEKNFPVINVKYRFNAQQTNPTTFLNAMEESVAFNRRMAEALSDSHSASFLEMSSTPNVLADLGVAPVRSLSVGGAYDPAAAVADTFCEHDFAAACPQGFARDVSSGECRSSSYTGPCASESHSFAGWTNAAKARFSSQCATSWPCKQCARNYAGSVCPSGFALEDGKCAPTASYSGPCMDRVDFSHYSDIAKAQFESSCGAFWACAA